MKIGFFKLEGMSTAVAAYDDESRWNGFGCPLFTKEQALHFIQEWDKIRTPGEDPLVFWHDVEQAFFIQYGDAQHHPMSGETVRVEDIGGGRYYRIGGFGWSWLVVEQAEQVGVPLGRPTWVQSMPVLSTAHLKQETAQLDWAGAWPMLVSAVPSDESGIFVKVRDTPKGEHPEELEVVFQWAKQLGYTWVRFDADGDVIEGLPVFDW